MILLDTHVWLWALQDSKRLSKRVLGLITDPEIRVFVSVVSLWEVAIKSQLGKLSVDGDIEAATVATGFEFLDLTRKHVAQVASLPHHHRDPFDRALIAQAIIDGLKLVTADQQFAAYQPEVKLISV